MVDGRTRLPEVPADWLTRPLMRFLRIEAVAGAVLLLSTLLALVLSNAAWSSQFIAMWEIHAGFRLGDIEFSRSLRSWINDALMTLFFFVLALELKRELVLGELRDRRMAALPLAAAFGGMVAPWPAAGQAHRQGALQLRKARVDLPGLERSRPRAGLLRCGVTLDARRRVTHVSVQMGHPRLTAAEIPVEIPGVAASERVLRQNIELGGRAFEMTCVSMGNPHAVIFVSPDEPGDLRALAEQYGPSLERHAWFPRRTNAEFARVRSATEIELVVWERGCGITLACGTGACATAVAAVLNGLAPSDREIDVHLPGGPLHITVKGDLSGVTMRGPADEVFEGELDLAALLARHEARHEAKRSSRAAR